MPSVMIYTVDQIQRLGGAPYPFAGLDSKGNWQAGPNGLGCEERKERNPQPKHFPFINKTEKWKIGLQKIYKEEKYIKNMYVILETLVKLQNWLDNFGCRGENSKMKNSTISI